MDENLKTFLIAIGGIAILLLFIAFRVGLSSSQEDNSYVCSVCERTFTNRDDKRSIAMTNMCEPCYDNFKYTQELLDESKKYEERNK